MISSLLRFELLYQRKLWALPAAMILFFLTGLQIGGQGFAPDLINFNAPYQISYYTSIFSLGAVFAIMFFVINGILRDKDHQLEEIIFSTGIRKYQFFLSRFIGVFLFSLLAVSPIMLGMISGRLFIEMDPDRLAPFSLFPYFWNWMLFILPNVFICSGFIFSVGLLTKNRMSVYASAVLIYVFYFVCSFYFNSPILADSSPSHTDNLLLASIGDPFGISAFMEQSQYLTPIQKNSTHVALTGNFLLNRLLWIILTIGCLGFTFRMFSFRMLSGSKQKTNQPEKEIVNESISFSEYAPIITSSSAFWPGFISQSKIGVKQLLKNLPFQVIIALTAFIIGSEFYARLVDGGNYSESLYPVSSLLAGMNNTTLFIFGSLLIVFFSGEWVWKERSENMHLILDATPVSNATFFWSKFAVLMCIPLLFITLEILIAIGFQFLLDYPIIDFGIYLSLYYFQGIPLVFCILLALFVQTFSPGKYLGMAITGMFIIVFNTPLSGSFGIEHPLLTLGSVPDIYFSGMNGVSNSAPAFYLLSSHWLILGFILSVLALKVWKRGVSEGFYSNLKQLTHSWKIRESLFLAVLLMMFLSTTGLIFFKVNVQSEYKTSSQILDEQAEYERLYKHYNNEKWLYPIAIKTDVVLFPKQQFYTVQASYTLSNKSDTSVSKALIIEKNPIKEIHLERATMVSKNETLGVFEFEFDEPIQPGDSVLFSFSVEKKYVGLQSGRDLVKNGSYISLRDFSPSLGYVEGREIQNNSERQKRGLPKKSYEQPSDADFDLMESGYGRVHFETILSVPASQTGISVGNLVDQWTENNRNYYRFVSPEPILPGINYFSADYQIEKENYDGISIEHYFQPGHDFNNKTIMNSIKQTLDYAQKKFGAYSFDHLRVAEIPSLWRFGGYASPGTISMVEQNLYLVDERDPKAFSLVAKRTIHEVSHQWWGHQLSTQNISGGSIFVEGFAKYTEAVVMEKYYGMSSLYQLGESANQTYFGGRSYASTPEQPLYLEQGEQYMLYGKSYMVMLALKDLIGEKELNGILKTLIDRHKNEIDATVTAPEFLDDIYSATPSKYHPLVNDWFTKIIIYDLAVEAVEYQKLNNGLYDILVTIKADRFQSTKGIETSVSMNEPVTLGLYTTHPSEANEQEILVLEPKVIKNGIQLLRFQAPALPSYVAIDPYSTRPDLVRTDNVLKVE